MAIKETKDYEIFLDGVTFAYNGSPVINQVTLGVRKGDFIGILGPNGAGKSTLIRLMTGMLTPKEGTAYIKAGPFGTIPSRKSPG